MLQAEHDLLGLRLQVVRELLVAYLARREELTHEALQSDQLLSERNESWRAKVLLATHITSKHALNICRCVHVEIERVQEWLLELFDVALAAVPFHHLAIACADNLELLWLNQLLLSTTRTL